MNQFICRKALSNLDKNYSNGKQGGKAAVQKYAQKMILNVKSWMGNVLSYSAMSGSIKFAAGCGFSNGVLAVYNKKMLKKSLMCRVM